MRCGEKCFHVQMEVGGEKHIKSVNARTPAEARKSIRSEFGKDVQIYSVRERKNKSHVR